MNNRIQKLYEQSWVEGSHQEPIQGELGDEQRYRIVKTSNFNHEHFARLLILECCDMANKRMQHNNPNDCLLVLDIKEHFGVTE